MAISNETESSSAPTLAIYDAAIETIRALMPFAHRFTNTIPSLLTDTQLEPHLPVLVEIANGFDESFCRFAQLYDSGIDTNEMILAANEGRSIAFAGGSVLSNIEIAYRVANEWHGSLFSDNCRLGKALRFEPLGITDEVIRQSLGDIEDYVDSIDKSYRVDLETLKNELIAERFRAASIAGEINAKPIDANQSSDDELAPFVEMVKRLPITTKLDGESIAKLEAVLKCYQPYEVQTKPRGTFNGRVASQLGVVVPHHLPAGKMWSEHYRHLEALAAYNRTVRAQGDESQHNTLIPPKRDLKGSDPKRKDESNRGRPPGLWNDKRAEFARPYRECDKPLSWSEIYEKYYAQNPRDTKAGPDTIRLDYGRRYGDKSDE